MPDRRVLVVRELTKKFEQSWRGPAPQVAAQLKDAAIKGECTLVLSRPGEVAAVAPDLDLEGCLLKTAREQGLSGRRLTETVAAAQGLPRRPVYQAYLALKEQWRLK